MNRDDLYKYIIGCLNRINVTNNIEELYQLEIYLKDYIKRYIDSNEERIK